MNKLGNLNVGNNKIIGQTTLHRYTVHYEKLLKNKDCHQKRKKIEMKSKVIILNLTSASQHMKFFAKPSNFWKFINFHISNVSLD